MKWVTTRPKYARPRRRQTVDEICACEQWKVKSDQGTGTTAHSVITVTDNGSKVEQMFTDSGIAATGLLDHV
jgi:hypothetical protein